MKKKKNEAVISGWVLAGANGWYWLNGRCEYHSGQLDLAGKSMNSSMVLRVDFEKGVAETANTIYRLQ